MSAKKKYFTTNFIHLIYKAHQILPTFTKQCYCLHLHSQCLHLSLTPNIPIPFHSTTHHHVSSTALDTHALLKTLYSHSW